MTSFQVLSYAGEISFHTQGRSSFMRRRMILQQQQGGFGRRTRQRSQGGRLPPRGFCIIFRRLFFFREKMKWGWAISHPQIFTNFHKSDLWRWVRICGRWGMLPTSFALDYGCQDMPVLPLPVSNANEVWGRVMKSRDTPFGEIR